MTDLAPAFSVGVAVHTPAHSALGDLLSYTSAQPLVPGTLVRVPLGQREVLGVVWSDKAEVPDCTALRAVAGVRVGIQEIGRTGAVARGGVLPCAGRASAGRGHLINVRFLDNGFDFLNFRPGQFPKILYYSLFVNGPYLIKNDPPKLVFMLDLNASRIVL